MYRTFRVSRVAWRVFANILMQVFLQIWVFEEVSPEGVNGEVVPNLRWDLFTAFVSHITGSTTAWVRTKLTMAVFVVLQFRVCAVDEGNVVVRTQVDCLHVVCMHFLQQVFQMCPSGDVVILGQEHGEQTMYRLCACLTFFLCGKPLEVIQQQFTQQHIAGRVVFFAIQKLVPLGEHSPFGKVFPDILRTRRFLHRGLRAHSVWIMCT